MAFDDVRLPDDIEQGARGGPAFKTSVIVLSSGEEQRNEEWSQTRGAWNVGYGITRKSEISDVVRFWLARRGRSRGFRFKDWSDFEGANELLGTGDGAATDFQLVRHYTDVVTFTKRITRPVAASVVVTVNAVATGAFTLQPGGIVRLTAPAPVGHQVRATFEFDVPVRFDDDKLDVNMIHAAGLGAGSIPSIMITELRE
jgi:uncharacterized protein (TIGR02217 family)